MLKSIRHLLFWATLLLITYAVWVAGGTQTVWQKPYLPFSIILFVLLLVLSSKPGNSVHALWRDPVFYVGGIFILLLITQWLNSGRELILDWTNGTWRYSSPPAPYLPWSIHRNDAQEMIRWFFPAWLICLYIRNELPSIRRIRFFLICLLYSSAALGLSSVIQYMIACIWGLCPLPSESYFFSAFGYANHAGAYFNLMLCLALGIWLDEMLLRNRRRPSKVILRGMAVLFLFFAANITHGRAAMIISWGVMGSAALYAVFHGIRDLTPSERFTRITGSAFALILVFLTLFAFEEQPIREEFMRHIGRQQDASLDAGGQFVKSAGFGSRSIQRAIAVQIVRDHFWFGTGGWGQRYLGYQYLPEDEWAYISEEGDANVHNDTLQFLGEFGVLGVSFLSIVLAVLCTPIFKSYRRVVFYPGTFFACLGAFIIYLYSYMELPFRSPGILFTWTAILTCISTLCSMHDANKNQTPAE